MSRVRQITITNGSTSQIIKTSTIGKTRVLWNGNEIQHRAFFDKLANELGFKHFTDWYPIQNSVIRSHGGGGILEYYDHSYVKALTTIYPHHNWQIFRFEHLPKHYLASRENILPFLEYVAKELHVRSFADWFRHPAKKLQLMGLEPLFRRYGGIHATLLRFYPQQYLAVSQNGMFAANGLYKAQRFLYSTIVAMLPSNTEVLFNYLHPSAKFESAHKGMELDIFIPSIRLAFEYQGSQHYKQARMNFAPLEEQQARDRQKKAAFDAIGIRIVEIPYWWDFKQESLLEQIDAQYPDALRHFCLSTTK
eukprot:TRINITY_DN6808_c0_g1_i1.p2 TRINITY_DN6808_c0_g1~~TRINITY_DN6808_c0_g1_i1.p2  ORF type:complete len:307 (-),score=68.94 TRINITY_DN6808_c0_g1_i1:1254-2174(-)